MVFTKRSAELLACCIGWICFGICCYHFFQLSSVIFNVSTPFDTDEADHANAALELMMAIRSGSFASIFEAIHRQSFYPPLHSFIVAPFYLFLSPSLASSRLPSLVLLIGSIFCFYIILKRTNICDRRHFLFASLCSLCFFVESPILAENSVLCMLELPGVFIVCMMLAVAAYHTWWQTAGLVLLSFALTLTKYSFAAMVIPAIFCWLFIETLHTRGAAQAIKRTLLSGLCFTILMIGWLGFARFDSVIKFFTSHPSYAPLTSWENLTFDLLGWIQYYHAHKIVGLFSAALILLSCFIQQKTPLLRLAQYIAINSFIVLLCSSTNEIRHFIVAFPPLILLTLYPLIHRSATTTAHTILRLLLVAALFFGSFMQLYTYRKGLIVGLEGKPELGILQETLMRIIDPSKPTLVIGANDQLSIESLRWHAAVAAHIPYTHVVFTSFPYREDKILTQQTRSRNVDMWLADGVVAKLFPQIIREGHFKQLVILRKIGVRDPLINSILQSNAESQLKRKKFGDRELIVADQAALDTLAASAAQLAPE
jgi:hypothetical protein